MARWTGTWLSGLGATDAAGASGGGWRGRGLGLPADGPGAVATTGSRVVAFVLDVLAGGLIGGLVNGFLSDPTPGQRALVGNGAFAVEVLLLTALTGQSLGMRVMGLRVQRLSAPGAAPGFLPAALRTALLVLLLPALVFDRDGRGLHDKAAGTVVVRTAGRRAGD